MSIDTVGPWTSVAEDPATPPVTLMRIAAYYPTLRSKVAANPASYDALSEWISEYGDQAVDPLALVAMGSPDTRPPGSNPLALVLSVVGGVALLAIAVVTAVVLSINGWLFSPGYDYSFGDADGGYATEDESNGEYADADAESETETYVDPATEVLPSTCDELYSDAMRASLESSGAALNPSWYDDTDPNGVAGTKDPTLYDLIAPRSRLDCRWLSTTGDPQWGIETTVAFLDNEQAGAVGAALAASGYRPLSELGGTRYVYEKTLADGSGHYGESHIVVNNVWFATHWSKFGPKGYTADMVTQVFG